MSSRIDHIDSIRFLAVFIILTTHVVAAFRPALLPYWDRAPWWYLLCGINGKLMVAVFGVLLGYFAFRAGGKNVSVLRYSARRYLYFAVAGLFVNALTKVVGETPWGVLYGPVSWRAVLKQGALIGDNIFPTFWCMRPFLAASVLSFVNGKYKAGRWLLLPEIAAFLFADPWISICLLGDVYALAVKKGVGQRLFSRAGSRAAAVVCVYVLAAEIPTQAFPFLRAVPSAHYVFYGCAAVLFLCLVDGWTGLRNALSNRVTARLGSVSMAAFLVHVVCYRAAGIWILGSPGAWERSRGGAVFLVYLTAVALAAALAFPVQALLNLCARSIDRGLSFAESRVF